MYENILIRAPWYEPRGLSGYTCARSRIRRKNAQPLWKMVLLLVLNQGSAKVIEP